ncbi:YqzG/YhdC family protein [Virgibacillus sediminis]|uniref:YqzG/YhdC family protein n=1 Tax=Virgibacillus sediminis TaxID=202260 RepID=A0ABV7A7H8_9BACI
MKYLFLMLGLVLPVLSPVSPIITQPGYEMNQEIPPYAKWGRLAVQETKKEYPNAQIIDYLHIGRESMGDSSKEKFKLWLREGEQEYGVFVTITFANETEEILDIKFEKTDR